MENEIVDDIIEVVRVPSISLKASLEKAGWRIPYVHWQNKEKRIVTFRAEPPSGDPIVVNCAEDDLPGRLRELFNSRL